MTGDRGPATKVSSTLLTQVRGTSFVVHRCRRTAAQDAGP